jgi:hypothetical protein
LAALGTNFNGLLWLAALVSAVGCSSTDDGRMEVYPVTGTVQVGGKPAEGAEVVFYGATPELQGPGTVAPRGVADANGVFHLQSYAPDDGAPAGKFNVTVVWPEPVPPDAGEMYRPKDRLNGKYAKPEGSGLTVEVPVGGGELPPFELK